jgi:hypothetical protein
MNFSETLFHFIARYSVTGQTAVPKIPNHRKSQQPHRDQHGQVTQANPRQPASQANANSVTNNSISITLTGTGGEERKKKNAFLEEVNLYRMRVRMRADLQGAPVCQKRLRPMLLHAGWLYC